MPSYDGVEVILETIKAENLGATKVEARIRGPEDIRLPTDDRVRICLLFGEQYDLKGADGVKITIAIGEKQVPSIRFMLIQSIWRHRDVLLEPHVIQGTGLWDHKSGGRTIPERLMRVPGPPGTVETATALSNDSVEFKRGSILVSITRGNLHHRKLPKRKPQKTEPPENARWLPPNQIKHIRPEWFEPLSGDNGVPYVVEFCNLGTFTDEIRANPTKYGRGKRKRMPTPSPSGYISDLRGLFFGSDDESPTRRVRSGRGMMTKRLRRQVCGPEYGGGIVADEDDEEFKPALGDWQTKREEEVEQGIDNSEQAASTATAEQEIIEISDEEEEVLVSVKREASSSATPLLTPPTIGQDDEDDEEMMQLRLQEILLRQQIRKRQLQEIADGRRSA